MPAYNANFEFEFRGIQGGKMCVTHLEYHREDPIPTPALTDLWSPAYAKWTGTLKAATSEKYTLMEIYVRYFGTTLGVNTVVEGILPLEEPGDIVGEVMPPNVIMAVTKVVDNLTIWPVTATPFRNGKVGFSGVPESSQDNGILTPAALGLLEAVAEDIEGITIDVGGTDYEFVLGLERPGVGGGAPEKVLVTECNAKQILGTQNTRKR